MDIEREFTISGSRYRATRRLFEERLAGEEPEAINMHAVEIGGRRYPVKQAVAVGLRVSRADFQSHEARRILRRLGFKPTEER